MPTRIAPTPTAKHCARTATESCGSELPMRLTNHPLLRYYAAMGLMGISVGLGVLQYGVLSMRTRMLQPQSTRLSSGSTVTLVGFMTMPSDSSE